MAAVNQDSATGYESGEVTKDIKDYCDQAVVNLKAGRVKETYLYANEALELDGKDAKAAALYRHALYTLHPKKRLIDKAKTLHEEADRFTKAWNRNKALELLSQAKKWHCTPGILWARSESSFTRRADLSYLDVTEALGMCAAKELSFVSRQVVCLRYLGYKVVPEIESEKPRVNKEIPARCQVSTWPKGLQIHELNVDLQGGHAEAVTVDGATLKPRIPLNHLARFLNDHVRGAMGRLGFDGARGDEAMLRRLESVVPRVLDEVTVPGRLHTDALVFTDFFHLPWANIERILDGRTLRASTIHFIRLRLPGELNNADKFLKLPTIRAGTTMILQPYGDSRRLPHHPPPLFSNAAVMEWAEWEDGRTLYLPSHYLASGLIGFIDAFKKDFKQATRAHSYDVNIYCPGISVVAGLGVRDEVGCNRLEEKMVIYVAEDRAATLMMGHPFETVLVRRLP